MWKAQYYWLTLNQMSQQSWLFPEKHGFIGNAYCTRYCYCYSYCCVRLPFMHGIWFGCNFSIGMNQDNDGPVLLDPFLSLMAQYCWLFPDKDCLRWLQPENFSCRSSHKLTPYSFSVSPCRLLTIIQLCISFSLLGGHQGLAQGPRSVKVPWLGNIRVPGGLLGYLRVRVLSLGPVYTSLIGCWGDALSHSNFLALPDLSGSLFVGSRSNGVEPRFSE